MMLAAQTDRLIYDTWITAASLSTNLLVAIDVMGQQYM